MKHLVGLSGGKDSTAMSVRLREKYPRRNFTFFCTPTGDELPEMEDHWNKLEDILETEIVKIYNPEYPTIYDLIDHMGALPNFQKRWCTRILKIENAQQYYSQFSEAIIYIGLRADEEKRKGQRGIFDENIKQKYPLRKWGWGIDKVWSYLNIKNISIPRRTDCGMCFYQRIGEWWLLWNEYPERYDLYVNIENKIGHTLMTPGKHKIWPHKLQDLRKEFEKGRKPREIITGKIKRQSGCVVCSL